MLAVGLEPTCLAATDFKSVVYTYSTMRAVVSRAVYQLAQAYPYKLPKM